MRFCRGRVVAATLLLLVSSAAGVACGGVEDDSIVDGDPNEPVRVFAASSLTEAFTEIADEYENRHGRRIELVFGGSAGLATQLEQGADAFVFASADRESFERAAEASQRDDGEVFARNRMALVVPVGNPAGIDEVADLDADGITYVMCAEEVPCGRAAAEVLDAAGVTRPPASREDRVTAVVAKVSLGEVDAGLVYATDAEAAKGTLESVEVPAALNAETEYFIGPMNPWYRDPYVTSFVDLVLGDTGRRILEDHGFEVP